MFDQRCQKKKGKKQMRGAERYPIGCNVTDRGVPGEPWVKELLNTDLTDCVVLVTGYRCRAARIKKQTRKQGDAAGLAS